MDIYLRPKDQGEPKVSQYITILFLAFNLLSAEENNPNNLSTDTANDFQEKAQTRVDGTFDKLTANTSLTVNGPSNLNAVVNAVNLNVGNNLVTKNLNVTGNMVTTTLSVRENANIVGDLTTKNLSVIQNEVVSGDLTVLGQLIAPNFQGGGNTGNPGSRGSTGATGAPGVTGSTGSTGNSGRSGATGSRGSSGNLGSTGATGLTGTVANGPTGNSGQHGNLGSTGSTGSTGNTGFTGDITTGVTGSIGNTGLTGNTGLSGSTGLSGNNGLTGQTGSTGANGNIGYTGRTGLTGNIGSTGNSGNFGSTGISGLSGSVGNSGNTGNTGITGSVGSTGTTGLTGNEGITGSTGDTGFVGNSGATGNSGVIGSTGNSGEAGVTGSTGLSGSTGSTGQAGATGATGAIGFTGATGFANSGATGSTGNTGSFGNTGSTGNFGSTGLTGAAGNPGSTGAIGAGAGANFGPLSTEYLNITAVGTGVTGAISSTLNYSDITNYNPNTPIAYMNSGPSGTVKFINLNNDRVLPVQVSSTPMGSFILQNAPSVLYSSSTGLTGDFAGSINYYKNAALIYTLDRWKPLINNLSWFVTTQQGPKLVATGSSANAQLGGYTSLSADGNTLAVGATQDTPTGATFIFVRSNGAWTQQGPKLVGSGATASSGQGIVVALSADGNTLAVAGANDSSFQGAVWIFTRTNGVWTQQGGKLVGTGAIGAASQVGCSLSADGNTLAIGGPADNGSIGATWIFTRTNGIWTQQGSKLVGTGNVGAAFQGLSTSLSADGNTLAVGGRNDNSDIGATWIFTRNNGTWTQQGDKLVGTNTSVALQGQNVSISADGNTLAVGGPADNGGINTGVGATWIFTRTNGIWAQQGNKLVGTGNIGVSSQGNIISLSASGNTLAVGGAVDNGGIGATWLFSRTNGFWTQQGNKLVGTGNIGPATQGRSVSLSADGSTLAVGGTNDNSSLGATWIFI